MSSPKNPKTEPPADAPPQTITHIEDGGDHDLGAMPLAPGPTRIRHVRFVTRGLIVSSPKEAEDAVHARLDNKPRGYDIWLYGDRFRFDWFDGGKLSVTKWMHISRIDVYEEWATAAPTPAQPSSAS